VAAPELSSRGGRAQSYGIHGSAGAHLGREARSKTEKRVAAPELNSARRQGPRPRCKHLGPRRYVSVINDNHYCRFNDLIVDSMKRKIVSI
jgi:hypothetical protein